MEFEYAERGHAWSLEQQATTQGLIEAVRTYGTLRSWDQDFLRGAEEQLRKLGYLSTREQEILKRLARKL